MTLIDGKAISEQVKQEIAAEVADIVARGGKRHKAQVQNNKRTRLILLALEPYRRTQQKYQRQPETDEYGRHGGSAQYSEPCGEIQLEQCHGDPHGVRQFPQIPPGEKGS